MNGGKIMELNGEFSVRPCLITRGLVGLMFFQLYPQVRKGSIYDNLCTIVLQTKCQLCLGGSYRLTSGFMTGH